MLAARAWVERPARVLATPWGRAVGVLWLSQIVAELAFSFALPFIPLYLERDLGVSDVAEAGLWAGAMAGGFAIAMGTMGPIWGLLADRYGRRLMVQRAMFGAAVMIGSMALVHSPQQLLVLRIAQGTLTGVVAATTTLVSLLVPRRHLASSLGLINAAQFAGGSLGPLLGGYVADHYGYRASFGATAAIFVISGALVTLFVQEPARETAHEAARGEARARVPEDTLAEGMHPVSAPANGQITSADHVERTGSVAPTSVRGAEGRASGGRGWYWLVRLRRIRIAGELLRREVLAVVALSAVIRFANLAPQPVLPLYIAQLGEDEARVATTVGLVLAATGIAAMVSALVVGRLADRYGLGATLLVCLVAAAVLSPLQAFVGTVWQLLALRTAMGFALGGTAPAIQAVITELTPAQRRGAAFGLLATAGAIGNGAGPVIGSAVAAAFGIPASFIVVAPVFLVCAVVVVTMRLTGSSGSDSPGAVSAERA